MRHSLTVPFLLLTLAIFSGMSSAQVVISEVDLANDKLEIVNIGTTSVDMSSWQLCNRVNGSPFYASMASQSVDAGNSTSTSLNLAPGELITLNVGNFTPDANGELGLYNSSSFGSTSAIEDYIAWGAIGTRDIVAAGAAIWMDDEFIDVSGIAPGETIQLIAGQPGNDKFDYSIAPSTLGSPQEGSVANENSSWSKIRSAYD